MSLVLVHECMQINLQFVIKTSALSTRAHGLSRPAMPHSVDFELLNVSRYHDVTQKTSIIYIRMYYGPGNAVRCCIFAG